MAGKYPWTGFRGLPLTLHAVYKVRRVVGGVVQRDANNQIIYDPVDMSAGYGAQLDIRKKMVDVPSLVTVTTAVGPNGFITLDNAGNIVITVQPVITTTLVGMFVYFLQVIPPSTTPRVLLQDTLEMSPL